MFFVEYERAIDFVFDANDVLPQWLALVVCTQLTRVQTLRGMVHGVTLKKSPCMSYNKAQV
jgi:hypothetical protein